MKVKRFNFYSSGMEPEASGEWIRASHLPPDILAEYVEERLLPTKEDQEKADAEEAGED